MRQLVGGWWLSHPAIQLSAMIFKMLMTALLCSCGTQGVLRAEGMCLSSPGGPGELGGARGWQGVAGVWGVGCTL